MLRSCCPIIKRSRREEQYHIKEDEPPKYSWEKERLDPAQYRFVDLYGDIVTKLDGHIAGQHFIIEKCKKSCILLLDNMAAVNVDDCESCVVVLGPCKGSVFIRNCKNMTVFAVCQQFRSRDCINTDVFLFCATKPIIESCKLMRFRSIAIFYDKLEEHMLKASLSPFINQWSRVHDFTPADVPNFEIRPFEYDDIESIDMIRNLKEVNFSPELSILPQYTVPKDAIGKKMLILCLERKTGSIPLFYGRILRFLRGIVAQGAQLITTRDIIVREGDLYSLLESKSPRNLAYFLESKKYAKHLGRLVTLEITWERKQLEEYIQMDSSMFKIVDDKDFERLRTGLYRLAQLQIDT